MSTPTELRLLTDWDYFTQSYGIRTTPLTKLLFSFLQKNENDFSGNLPCVTVSTPPQEGKSVFVIHYIAWLLIRNPWLNVVYASYNQARSRAISRQIRDIVQQHIPLKRGSSGVSYWETFAGGGLLAAGRGSAMTGFRSDFTVIDDPIKDMVEANSVLIRDQVISWFTSVVLTRMSSLSKILVIATRWHKDDLINYCNTELSAAHLNIPAQAVDKNDPLHRAVGDFLPSVQNRSESDWLNIKKSVGSYVWNALYQGDPKELDKGLIDTSMIDIIPWENVVYQDSRGFMHTKMDAVVIQSWDLTFGTVNKKRKNSSASPTSGDYVAGHVYAIVGGKWILVDRVHKRMNFTQTLSALLKMSAKWIQTNRIYVEKAANGAAVIDALKSRAALIKPVVPKGSKEARVLSMQPIIDAGGVAVLDSVYDSKMFTELADFPFAKHDDDVDAMSQALNHGRQDYLRME